MKLKNNQPVHWSELLTMLGDELAVLDNDERLWLMHRVALIATLQQELDALFESAEGPSLCAGCDGACCDCGLHHVTLTNLLPYLLEGEEPPSPDFSRPCPFLGAGGCLLPITRRPYNCITFFCEALEDRLTSQEVCQLRSLDQKLRREYQRVAARYPAASLRGLWIALQRQGTTQILSTMKTDVLE